MVMLILETFVLMLLSAVLGTALGWMLAEAYGAETATDRPWLRDLGALPAAPALPSAPELLPDDERARLAAALAETRAAPVESAPVEPAAAPVAEASIAPASVEPAPAEPAPVAPIAVEEPIVVEEPVAPVEPPPPVIAAADAARAAEADAHGARPAGLLGPRDGKADDLKRIKGIGKQNEARLNALGVWHFDQIAAWTPANIGWAGSFLAFVGRIEREDWVGQAKVLAAGGTTEFAARVDAGEVPTSSSAG
ncbi:MAG: hypothetical protein LWW93_12540 [Hyphomicrobiales bacterium]|nr:hypothetical protein [Hyphomicrobiales bacterium]